MGLTRELKEMWLFGPLRSLKEGEARANARIEEDAKAVAAIIDSLMKGDGEQKSTEEKPIEEKENQDQTSEEEEDSSEG